MRTSFYLAVVLALTAAMWPGLSLAETADSKQVEQVVDKVILPLMQANGIKGMAVGVLVDGQSYVFNYGLASASPRRPVTDDTLFEIGSISKTFAATLASYAQQSGDLSLNGMASQYLPSLQGSAFDHVSLIDLGTHTPGGLPLQVPDGIDNESQLIAYFRAWKPAYAPGTMRTYNNPGIGLLGIITAHTMHADYTHLVQDQMFPAFGMADSFIRIPPGEMDNYAQGETKDGAAIRLVMAPAGPEAYGVRTTAADLLHFLAINMNLVPLDPRWQRAVLATHTGYNQLRAGGMVQDLIWEQYDLPVTLAKLQAGSAPNVALNPNPVTAIVPPSLPRADVLIEKSGSTNGFASFVAFIPADHAGVVLLANRNYPMSARVAAIHAILASLKLPGVAQ